MKKLERPAQTIFMPSCACPSRSSRSARPFSRSTSTVVGSSTPARMRERTCSRVCRSSTTLATPWRCRISASSMPAGPPPMIATCVRNLARARHAARLEERFERLAAEGRDHLRIRHALRARQLLEAEEARAVVLHRLPVEAPHQVALFGRERLHRRIRVTQEKLALLLLRQRMQEAIEAQPLRAALEVEDVLSHKW